MGLIQLHKPALEPIDLTMVKDYLRIDHHDEDALIEHLIRTARQSVESYTARSFIRQAWRFTFNAGHGQIVDEEDALYHHHRSRGIELPRSPFIEMIDKPQLIDSYGTRTIEGYHLNMASRLGYFYFNQLPATVLNTFGQIQIDFWAGYGGSPDDVPEPLRHAILITLGHLYKHQSSANDNGMIFLPLAESVVQLIRPYQRLRL